MSGKLCDVETLKETESILHIDLALGDRDEQDGAVAEAAQRIPTLLPPPSRDRDHPTQDCRPAKSHSGGLVAATLQQKATPGRAALVVSFSY